MKALLLLTALTSLFAGCAVDAEGAEGTIPLNVGAPGKADGEGATQVVFDDWFTGATFSATCDELVSCNMMIQFEVDELVGEIPFLRTMVTRHSDGLDEVFTLEQRLGDIDYDDAKELRAERDRPEGDGSNAIRGLNGSIVMSSPNEDETFTLQLTGRAAPDSSLSLTIKAEWW